jgi:transposase-like protein
MAKTKRNAPKRAASSEATATLFEFEARFPDDAACLDWLVGHLYPNGRDGLIYCPKCDKETRHYRVKDRTCYECQFCGHQEYPMRGTVFEGSSTSLRLWFYGIYLMASTRCGISAKTLEREIGVSYPTALRMFRQIRTLLAQDDDRFGGTVEVDEAFIGGQGKWKHGHRAGHTVPTSKSMVLGMAERGERGAKISATVILDPPGRASQGRTLAGHVTRRVLPASVVFTDEAVAYWPLGRAGYAHSRVNHSAGVYVSGDVHTNTIEGFWSLVKRGISGTYHNVSAKYLQTYLDEYVFRYNNREHPAGMFDAFLNRIEKASPASLDRA